MTEEIGDVSKIVAKKNIKGRLVVMTLGFLLVAFNYNLFLVKNSLVIGGTSGLAIIVNKFTGIEPVTFIYITGFFLIILSYFIIGRRETFKNAFGSIFFPLCVTITLPLANFLADKIIFENFFLTILISGVLCGISDGMIYKSGFSTAGMDIVRQIVNKYIHISAGKADFYTNLVIILAGGAVFGPSKIIYAALILLIRRIIIDRILLGISDNKMFFIYTKKIERVKKYITDDLNTGVTLFKTEGGYTQEKGKMIMCVVTTRDYYRFKQSILTIDPQAFIVINDCYEVSGGKKKNKYSFI